MVHLPNKSHVKQKISDEGELQAIVNGPFFADLTASCYGRHCVCHTMDPIRCMEKASCLGFMVT